MKILLIGNYINDNQISMKLFAGILKQGLEKLNHQVRLIRPVSFFGKLKPSYRGIGKWLGYIDKFIIFPFQMKRELERPDIVHICDHSNAFYTKYLKKVPNVITCHDLLAIRSALGEFRENRIKWTGRQFQKIILKGLNKSKHVVCISESTKRDLLQISSIEDDNISVVYYGLNYPYSRLERGRSKEIIKSLKISCDWPFLLHVGKDNWYKNRLGVLEIFRHLTEIEKMSDLHLVMVGGLLSPALRAFIKKYNLESKVSVLPIIGRDGLQALYSMAKGLLFPSIHEGFGWPIVEAQACGCPVFATDRPPMTESGGEAAAYFNPDNPEEAARIITDTFKDSKRVEEMRQKGFENAKRFDAERMIDEYVKVYRKVIENKE